MTKPTTTVDPLHLLQKFGGSTTTAATPPANGVPKPSANGNKRPTPIMIYPTVTPESIVVPIVSCIFGFPLLALTVICCLRRRAKLARYSRSTPTERQSAEEASSTISYNYASTDSPDERARRRNCELDRGELSVVRLSPVKAKLRPVSLVRSPRQPPSLELDTVLEERSDPEQTTVSQVEITPDREVGALLLGAVGAAGTAAAAAGCTRDS